MSKLIKVGCVSLRLSSIDGIKVDGEYSKIFLNGISLDCGRAQALEVIKKLEKEK